VRKKGPRKYKREVREMVEGRAGRREEVEETAREERGKAPE
jgi:hypothetical protein